MRDLTQEIAESIAVMEGFYKEDSLSQRNNNPGNIRIWGNNPIEKGYVKFPTVEQGWVALRKQVDKNIARGLNLLEFFGGKPGVYGGYAPAADKNNPGHYANFVADRLGISSTAILKAVILA